ncbi:MAG TPA: alpha/beta hydrolase [Pyrinomonadaceae bacterium]|nr:alpha/beta hydrolase [Pyrinomonadaceae bacterium]
MTLLTSIVLRRTGFVAVIILLVSVFVSGQSGPEKVSVEKCAGLHCELSGSGDPIIALHGLGASLYSWRELVGKIPNHRLILIDFRGAGKSIKPRDKHYSSQHQAELIYQYIREKDLKNLTLMGNSYGGAVALLVTLKLINTPEDKRRLSRLILIGSGAYEHDQPGHLKLLRTPIIGRLLTFLVPRIGMKKVLKESYYDKCGITDEQIDAYLEPISSSAGRYALVQTAKQAVPKNIKEITEKYPTIEVPTLILWGEDDRILSAKKTACRLDKDIGPSTLVVIKYAGHVPQEEQPAATICQINLFLGSNIPCPPQVPRAPDPSRRCKPRVPPKDPFKECPVKKQ